jgi:flagellar biosynthesis GTPase FlhF
LKSFNNKDGLNLKLETMRQRWHDDSIGYAAQKERALNVIADLVHDKAVRDPASVKWFGLSSTEFLVNGQKQPDEMQQKYKAKYGIYEGNGLYYGPVQMHGVGVFIDADPSRPPLPPGSPRPPKAQREPRSGYVQPKYVDTNAWKLRQLIKQQQAFAADQDKQRAKLVEEQQRFVEQENKKREQLIHQQEAFVTDQNKKREKLMHQQQADQAKQREQIERQQQTDMAKKQEEIKRWQKNYLAEQQQRAKQFGELYKGPRIPLQDIMANITDDLVSANVLKNKSDLVKFNLTNSALMVNGVKQSDELHDRLKAKYLEKPDYKINADIAARPNFGLHFNAQNGAMGLGITDGPDSP